MPAQLQCSICGRTQPVETTERPERYTCPDCARPPVGPQPPARATVSEADGLPVAAERVMTEFGNYEIIEEISRGGVGIVYKARQKGLNRIVALKVLQAGTAATSTQVQRFLHEAQAAAKLQHPNIVPIHDFGVHDGLHYFSMDFIEGESLAEVLARGPMPVKDALEIVRQTADALEYAHQNGIIHRDIKPGNILLDASGRVKVTDFGLAKELDRDQMHLTVTGQVMGTPRYMSPEQAAGKTARADARSDIFSLGVTLYEMLTGRPAFEADNVVAMLQKILTEEPPRPHKLNRKIHRDVETICLKAIEKDPDRRYQSAQELAEDIERFLAGEPIEAKPASWLYRATRRARKHARALAVYALVLVATGHGVAVYLKGRPSHLQLQVEPSHALVALDRQALSDEELAGAIRLPAGHHELLVEAEPLYEPQQISFETRPGESRTMHIALQRRKGTLQIHTEPPDAGVTVAGAENYRATFQGPTIELELPTGHYTVFVHKDNHLAQGVGVEVQPRRTHTLNFSLLPITLWAQTTSGNVLSVPAVGDLDGDGFADVVAGDDDGRIYCLSGRNGIALWVYRTADAVQAPVSMADVNRDDTPDVIVGSTDGWLYCLSGKTGQLLWKFQTRGPIFGPALLKDVSGDGIADVFVGSDDGFVYAVAGADGALLWKYHTTGRINSSLAWAREGNDDVLLVGSTDRFLYCLQPRDGALLWKLDTGAPLLYPAMIELLDPPGGLVALLPTPRSPAEARTQTAVSLAERKRIGVSDTFPRRLDLDGDGKPEKLLVTERQTLCFAGDGTTERWRSEYLAVTPHLADVNGDGTLDLVFNNGPDQLVCLSGSDGSLLGQIKLEAATGRGFVLEDIDRDGTPDVVVGAGNRLSCFSWVGGRKRWMNRAEAYFDAPFAFAEGLVFTKTVGGEIACYEPGRKLPRWVAQTAAQPSPYAGVAAGHGVVVDADAHGRLLRAFSAADGTLLWQVPLPGKPDSPVGAPAIGGDVVVVGDGNSGFYCFALADGTLRWQIGLPQVTTAAAFDADTVYVPDGNSTLHCLALADGSRRWKFPVSDPFASAPALVDVNGDGRNDAVAASDNGFVYALDGGSGEILWQHQFSSVRVRSRNRIVLADLTGDGYPEGVMGTAGGELLCLDLRRGRPRWTYPVGKPILSEPAIGDVDGDGVPDVLVGTMGRRLHCISGRGDRQLWSYQFGAQIRYSAPLFVPGQPPLVLIGTGPPENGLYCLSAAGPRINDRGWSGPWKELTVAR